MYFLKLQLATCIFFNRSFRKQNVKLITLFKISMGILLLIFILLLFNKQIRCKLRCFKIKINIFNMNSTICNVHTQIRLSMQRMKRFLRIPDSFKSPNRIMSSTPSTDVVCMWRIGRLRSIQCSLPSSSTTLMRFLSWNFTRAPMDTANSPLEVVSNQM